MTDLPPDLGDAHDTHDAPVESGRTSSVRLREVTDPAGRRGDNRMDAANQSLADALRLTYRLVQFAMVVLVVLFLASGAKTVKEGEVGIATMFGRPTQNSLEPGFHFAWPYPVGEVVTIGSGTVELRINRAFFMHVKEGEEDKPESDLSQLSALTPGRDGSVITADQNLAHTQWTVNYRRSDHLEYAENVPPDLERPLVQHAVERAIVQAVAETTIDDLLKDRESVASRATQIAQDQLRAMKTGIVIEQLVLNRKIPPTRLLTQFQKVQNAAQTAGQASLNARSAAESELNRVAGSAAPVLISQINEYERAVELGETDEADAILARIDAVLDGNPVEIDGQTVQPSLSGEAAEILADANRKAYAMVEKARADAELFKAMRAQRDANAPLTYTQEWSKALSAFMGKAFVQSFIVPQGSTDTLELRLNADPDIVEQLDREQKRQEAERTNEERERARQEARFRTQRGVNRDSDD